MRNIIGYILLALIMSAFPPFFYTWLVLVVIRYFILPKE